MIPVFKHPKRSTTIPDVQEVTNEDYIGESITVTALRAVYYISTDMDVMIDQTRDPEYILREIKASLKDPIKDYM